MLISTIASYFSKKNASKFEGLKPDNNNAELPQNISIHRFYFLSLDKQAQNYLHMQTKQSL